MPDLHYAVIIEHKVARNTVRVVRAICPTEEQAHLEVVSLLPEVDKFTDAQLHLVAFDPSSLER